MIKKIFKKNKNNKHFINKYKKDDADGTLVFFIASLPFLVSTLSLVVGIAQTVEDQRNLDNIFQDATQHAISYVGTDGYLNGRSVEAASKEIKASLDPNNAAGKYGREHNQYKVSGDAQDKFGNNVGFKLCTDKVSYDEFSGNGFSFVPGNYKYHFMIGLDKDRTAGESFAAKKNYTDKKGKTTSVSDSAIGLGHYAIYHNNGGGAGTDLAWAYSPENKYKVIYVKGIVNLYDYIANPFDPEYDGCKSHYVNASAITFGSSADVDYGDKATKGEGGDFYRKETIEEKLGLSKPSVENLNDYVDQYGNNPF